MKNAKFAKILRMILLPCCFAFPFIGVGFDWNYTGLFNAEPVNWAKLIPSTLALIYLGKIFYQLTLQHFPHTLAIHKTVWLWTFVIATILMPYRGKEDFFSGMHVLLGYVTFFYFSYLFYEVTILYPKLRYIYLGGLVLAFAVSVTCLSINGLAEVIYISFASIAILELDEKKDVI